MIPDEAIGLVEKLLPSALRAFGYTPAEKDLLTNHLLDAIRKANQAFKNSEAALALARDTNTKVAALHAALVPKQEGK